MNEQGIKQQFAWSMFLKKLGNQLVIYHQNLQHLMYRSIRNFIIPPPPGISREFDFKSSPGSREFDVLNLPCGGAFDKGGEFEPEVLTFCPFLRAFCMHRKDFALAANTVFSDFEGNSLNFMKKLAQRIRHVKAMCFI
jgi:hypothetical protein